MLKKVFFAVSLLLGLGLFVFVIVKFGGIEKTLAVVGQVGWLGMAIYIANAAIVMIAPGIGWYILMRGEGLNVPLGTALKANFMGFPINILTPTLFLGAEPLKLYYVAQTHGVQKRKVLATIIVSKFQEMGALLFVMIVAAGISVWKVDFFRQHEAILIACMAFLILLFGLTLYSFLGNLKPTVKIINIVAGFRLGQKKLPKLRRKLARVRQRAREMEHLIRLSFTKRWKTFLASQAVTLLSALSILMRPWIFFFAKERIPLPTEQLCGIYVVTNLANSLPLTPGGLGLFDGGMMALFSFLELGKENAAGFSLATRMADSCFLILGAWLIFHYGMQSVARRTAKGEEKVSVSEAQGEDEGTETREPAPDQ